MLFANAPDANGASPYYVGHTYIWSSSGGSFGAASFGITLSHVFDPAPVVPSFASTVEECDYTTPTCIVVEAVIRVRALTGSGYLEGESTSMRAHATNGQVYESTAGNIATDCSGPSAIAGRFIALGKTVTFCWSFIVPTNVRITSATYFPVGARVGGPDLTWNVDATVATPPVRKSLQPCLSVTSLKWVSLARVLLPFASSAAKAISTNPTGNCTISLTATRDLSSPLWVSYGFLARKGSVFQSAGGLAQFVNGRWVNVVGPGTGFCLPSSISSGPPSSVWKWFTRNC